MAMTKSQQTYALERIKEIHTKKIAEFKSKNTFPGKKLSIEEKLDLIYTGTVYLKPRTETDRYSYLYNSYDFSAWEYSESMSPEHEKELKDIEVQYKTVCDYIMLGDAVEALEAIENFK